MIYREALWLLILCAITTLFILAIFRGASEYCRTCGAAECDYNCWGKK